MDSLIETSISRDVLLLSRVEKPALLRQLFHLGCAYAGQILSYQKMRGQIQEAGNTTTQAHYPTLLARAGLLTGLSKFSGRQVKRRASSPKLQPLNTALVSALGPRDLGSARAQTDYWGRLVETAVGAHLANATTQSQLELFYWRERNQEVDFVLCQGEELVALEVKSGPRSGSVSGLKAFASRFKPKRQLLIGQQGIPVEEFLATWPEFWFN